MGISSLLRMIDDNGFPFKEINSWDELTNNNNLMTVVITSSTSLPAKLAKKEFDLLNLDKLIYREQSVKSPTYCVCFFDIRSE